MFYILISMKLLLLNFGSDYRGGKSASRGSTYGGSASGSLPIEDGVCLQKEEGYASRRGWAYPFWIQRVTVNKRAVCILLECIPITIFDALDDHFINVEFLSCDKYNYQNGVQGENFVTFLKA